MVAEEKDGCTTVVRAEVVYSRTVAAGERGRPLVNARRRVEQVVDDDSFLELEPNIGGRVKARQDSAGPCDGVVAGYGTVDGRPVAVFAVDRTVSGGALSEALGRKIVKVMDAALKTGCPVIGIHDPGSPRPGEHSAQGVHSEIFRRQVHSSGLVPQIALVMGSCIGTAAYSPALADFIVMAERTAVAASGSPDSLATATGEHVLLEERNGACGHSAVSGVARCMAGDEEGAIEYVRALLSYLPSNNCDEPPAHPYDDPGICSEERELNTVVPASPNQPYDMRQVVEQVVDDGEFLETQPLFAPNIVTGFGRIEGRSVGVVANQPMQFGGCLDADASEKAARFVRTCDAFNVPVLTFVDAPGFLPTAEKGHHGLVRGAPKLIYAYGEATVPLITIVTRKAYGGAYDVMSPQHLGADLNLAWPTAQIAQVGPNTAIDSLLPYEHLRISAMETMAAEELRAKLTAEYEETVLSPYVSAERGDVDAVIEPASTRQYIIRGLRALRTKREILPAKKHGNIPL